MAPFPIRFIKTDPADEVAFEKGLNSYQQYHTTQQPQCLQDAIQSFQSCLDSRLETRRDLAARGRPESREFSEKIAKVYLNLTIALLSQYEKQPTPTNLHRLAQIEPNLLKEWGTDHPQNYVPILYNVATAYNRGYIQAISQPPSSTLDPPNDTSTISPEQLFSRAYARFEQILNVQNGVTGMASRMRGMALSGLAKLELLQYQHSRSPSTVGDTHALDKAISHFKEASLSFSILDEDKLLLRECLDNLATAYYKRFEVDPARNRQDLDDSIKFYNYVRPQYNAQHDGAEKTAWIKCSHHLAMALYKRYEPSQPHNHPGRQQQDYLTASNVDLPANTAALEDLTKAREVETEAKDVLDALGEDMIGMLGLRETKRDVDNLWSVLQESSAGSGGQLTTPDPDHDLWGRLVYKSDSSIDWDASIAYFKDALLGYQDMQEQDNDLSKIGWIKYSHLLAWALCLRYKRVIWKGSLEQHSKHPKVLDAELPKACLQDLEEASDVEDGAKGLLDYLGPVKRAELGLEESYEDVKRLVDDIMTQRLAVTRRLCRR